MLQAPHIIVVEIMIEPAPKVEAAKASAARPSAAPDEVAEPAISSMRVSVDVAPAVEPAFAEPPTTESGSIMEGAKENIVTLDMVEQSQ